MSVALVVDDDPAVLELVAEMLAELGCEVITQQDGGAALAALAQDHWLPLTSVTRLRLWTSGTTFIPAMSAFDPKRTPGVSTRTIHRDVSHRLAFAGPSHAAAARTLESIADSKC